MILGEEDIHMWKNEVGLFLTLLTKISSKQIVDVSTRVSYKTLRRIIYFSEFWLSKNTNNQKQMQ
jgi:hypothetical protein